MLRKILPLLVRGLLVLVAAIVFIFGLTRLIAEREVQPHLYTVDTVPTTRVAIVFGAGLLRNGTPSAVLRDRVETAAELYKKGKVEKLLMSGDNRFVDYNEPGAMHDYAVDLGVPEQDIVLDYAGRRTYDTCYRARHIFGVDDAVLITQSFHMTRAVYTCSALGLQTVGVPSDVRQYQRRSYMYWYIREIPATAMAFWEVWISRPLPVLGKPEPIFSASSFALAGKLIATKPLSLED